MAKVDFTKIDNITEDQYNEAVAAGYTGSFEKYYVEIMKAVDINILSDKFLLAFEIGEDMEKTLTHILETNYKGIMYKFEKDIYGKTRFLYIVKDEGITYVA